MKQTKKHVNAGDWYFDENNKKVTVLSVAQGWCMVITEGYKKPFIVPEEFVLATFNA